MKRNIVGWGFAIALLGLAPVPSLADEPAKHEAGPLKELRAFLYHESTGKFDEYDLTKSPDPLKNVALHSGDGPSNATLVMIDIERAQLPGDARLELLATASGRTLFKGSAPVLRSFSGKQDDPIAIPFIVHGTGCEPVKLSARLLDKKGRKLSSKAKSLDFSCWYD